MRTLLFATLLATLCTPACSVWDPDYQPDPDTSLRNLLDSVRDSSTPPNAVQQEQLRFAIERLATRHPGHVPSQIAASALAFESGEPQRAQGYIDRAMALEPSNVEARCLRIRIAVADGSLGLARKLVDDGLGMRPDAHRLYESSAWLYQLEGRTDEAMQHLDAAEALEAPQWRIAFHRGLLEEQRGKLDVAEQHYRAALDANADCAKARQRLDGLAARRKVRRN